MKINKKTIGEIIAHAQRERPLEACGYLGEKDGIVCSHFALTNIDQAMDHFSMAPEEQFAAIKKMRRSGMSLRAVYHSHPESPARPSAEDIRLAHDPDISFVIVSLLGDAEDVRSFRIKGKEVEPEAIVVVE